MIRRSLVLLGKAARNPRLVSYRVRSSVWSAWERATAGHQLGSRRSLLAATGASHIDALWERLAGRAFAVPTTQIDAGVIEAAAPGGVEAIQRAAERAMRREVDLLGSGVRRLSTPIDWHTDFKVGITWPPEFFKDYEYSDLDRPSDVKVPWELSRLHWLIPAGQAYLLTGDERYAEAVRDVIWEWIRGNPFARSVNWACTMEPALRILTWTWMFHVFQGSHAWRAPVYREDFLRALFLHGRFVANHLEVSPVAGNHYTADAVGLMYAGLFFGEGREPRRWANAGWEILLHEIGLQTHPDGGNFEASVPYHRLVAELFFLAACYRWRLGLDVPRDYQGHLRRMAEFTFAYCGPDGSVPLLGDGDDARALPFGSQRLNDHRYLAAAIGVALGQEGLVGEDPGPLDALVWMLGAPVLEAAKRHTVVSQGSMAFPAAGCFVMRSGHHQVFIDCGPVGQRGRGGHGHNDCLSFEAVLHGIRLIRDCGSYVYTASWQDRNQFRSTAYHNTPQVDGQEINRLVHPRNLWTLLPDAEPDVRRWDVGDDRDIFAGAHRGYERLPDPVTPVRTVILEKPRGILVVHDRLEGKEAHNVCIRIHLATDVDVVGAGDGMLTLLAHGRRFRLVWEGPGWSLQRSPGRISPSYGIVSPCICLEWHRSGPLPSSLLVGLAAEGSSWGPLTANLCREVVARDSWPSW